MPTPMTLPQHLEIYEFEDQWEMAVQTWLLQNGVNDPKKQKEYGHKLEDGSIKHLKTPRVEVRYLNTGFAQNEHYYCGTVSRWLDITAGTTYLKIVTRRSDTSYQEHRRLRSLCRYLMQWAPNLTALMTYHEVEKIIESQSAITLEADRLHDLSSLSFQTWLRIQPQYFPTTV